MNNCIVNSKRIHREQKVSIKDLRTFAETIPTPVMMLDQSKRIVAYSKLWPSSFGIKDEIHGDLFTFHFSKLKLEEMIDKVLTTEEIEVLPAYEYQEQEKVRHFQIKVTPWENTENNIGGVMILLEDITVLKEKELALQEHNDELKQFAYITTHDVKSPITNINSFLHFLKEDKSITDPSSLQAIHWIEKSIDKANAKINDLVKVIEQREASVLMENIEMEPLIEDLKKSITVDELSLNDHLKVEFLGESYLKSSKKQLITILENLLTNGLRYRKNTNDLQLELRIDTTPETQTVISVKDNGVGIDLSVHMQRIFGMFKRANDVIEGNGLGLYLTKQACEQLKGKIDVTSQLGKGTTFFVYLPK
ncbi:PAS domain-containing sensor histidine kinase [Flammeovirga aprica]|uniref:histidine kinase n=1 Tax=Flammeovirga aprica JL-4 TaxID=694437 RepID=A0A7X9P2J8_9BACT|nr:PAS domain-containing sensor histidine kinase [Flammeovirga aprica]NME67484.1 PAS domain S-box protein [Flammeovirga aprica JL-4]